VILWSLFNEEGLERVEEGMEIARYMNAAVKRLDVTRPTTGGQDKGQGGCRRQGGSEQRSALAGRGGHQLPG
jgi:hypothetical protein